MRLTSETLENGYACRFRPGLAEGHDDAANDQGSEELEQPGADTRDDGECRLREVADLRLLALDQRRQVSMSR